MFKKAFVLFAVVSVAFSCLDQPDCLGINNNWVGISFRRLIDGQAVAFPVDSLYAIGAQDTLYAVTGSSLAFEVNQFSTETVVKVHSDGRLDSLVFSYEVQTQFVSEDCGERYVLSNLSVVKHTFDSLRMVSAVPGRDRQSRNLEIFF